MSIYLPRPKRISSKRVNIVVVNVTSYKYRIVRSWLHAFFQVRNNLRVYIAHYSLEFFHEKVLNDIVSRVYEACVLLPRVLRALQLGKVTETLQKQLETGARQLTEYREKYNIRVRGEDESSRSEPTKTAGTGVLVANDMT